MKKLVKCFLRLLILPLLVKISDLKEFKTEEYIDENGHKSIIKYYKTILKDTKEAKKIKEKINSNKSNSSDVTSQYIPNPYEEGDFRIAYSYGTLNSPVYFDSVSKNYYSVLKSSYYEKALNLVSGFVVSNPVIGYFTGTALSEIQNGYQGDGLANARERLVYKYGQV